MSTHFTHRSVGVALCVIFCLQGQIARAEWSEAALHTELNDLENGYIATCPSLSADQLHIVFYRAIDAAGNCELFEASREDPTGPFIQERLLNELNPVHTWIRGPWLSNDGLRLYYSEGIPENGRWNKYEVIQTAVRDSVSDEWRFERTLWELHVPQTADRNCVLSDDEKLIMWRARRPNDATVYRVFMATRNSLEEPFSNEREVEELTAFSAESMHLSDDGLTIYVTGREDNGYPNIYKATRGSLDAPFGDFEVLGICGPDLPASRPWLSPDEKTIYYNSSRDGEFGIFVSYWIDDPYDVAVESIEAAIAAKREAIAAITLGMDKDREVLEALNELGETGDVDPKYIEGTKRYVLNAIKRQMKAIAELEKSIRELEKALEEL